MCAKAAFRRRAVFPKSIAIMVGEGVDRVCAGVQTRFAVRRNHRGGSQQEREQSEYDGKAREIRQPPLQDRLGSLLRHDALGRAVTRLCEFERFAASAKEIPSGLDQTRDKPI